MFDTQPQPVKTPNIAEAIEARYHAAAAMRYQAEVQQLRPRVAPVELAVYYGG